LEATTKHRAHDYAHLMERWRHVARAGRLRLKVFAETGGMRLVYLRSPALAEAGGIYISAGIHGDEPAAPDGLISWAEQRVGELAELPLMIFPCLNPWGLVNNTRVDRDGHDLNRLFHTETAPVVNACKSLMAPHQFTLALMLHEDYDAQGAYLYEVQRELPFWGESLLEVASDVLPIDPRGRIDGRLARSGIVRRRFEQRRFATMGYPEAIYLHVHHARRSLTFETPSEFALAQRSAAHVKVIDACVRRALAPYSTQIPR